MAKLKTCLGQGVWTWLVMTCALGCGDEGQTNNATPSVGGNHALAGGGSRARGETSVGDSAGAQPSSAITGGAAQSAGTGSLSAGTGGGNATNQAGTGGASSASLAGASNAMAGAGTSSSVAGTRGSDGGAFNGTGGGSVAGSAGELPRSLGGTTAAGGLTNGLGGGHSDTVGGASGNGVVAGGTTGASGGTAGATAGSAATTGSAGAAGAPQISECFPTMLQTPNVVVLHDASPSGADVEGRLWVGGSASFAGYGVSTEESFANCADFGLVVGGTLSGQLNAGRGKIAAGSIAAGSAITTSCPKTSIIPVDFQAVAREVKTLSTALLALPAAGTVSQTAAMHTLMGSSATLNVFSINASQVNGITIDVPPTSTVVVNVAGTAVNWTAISFQMPGGGSCRIGTSNFCSHVIFNFYEATSLSFAGIGLQGSVLAPYAALRGAGGGIDGQVFVDSMTGSLEYHTYPFSGCLR